MWCDHGDGSTVVFGNARAATVIASDEHPLIFREPGYSEYLGSP